MINPKLHIETDLSKVDLEKTLKNFEPWRIGITFSNGLSTADFRTIQPFSDIPLNKLRLIGEHMGEDNLRGLRALDIGSNIGYNTIALTRDFGCKVTGLDFNPGNVEKARWLAGICDVDAEFEVGDANTYCKPGEFDLILHLGTLYHLADPVGGLRCAAQSLKPGGQIYVETTTYESGDEYACRYIHGYKGDYTNFWALSEKVVSEILERYGVPDATMIRKFGMKYFEGTGMARAIFCGKKPE
ncbi:class I SAM-dependent methyltransferase [Hyphomonas sp.]